jgi:hypothetical protein
MMTKNRCLLLVGGGSSEMKLQTPETVYYVSNWRTFYCNEIKSGNSSTGFGETTHQSLSFSEFIK